MSVLFPLRKSAFCVSCPFSFYLLFVGISPSPTKRVKNMMHCAIAQFQMVLCFSDFSPLNTSRAAKVTWFDFQAVLAKDVKCHKIPGHLVFPSGGDFNARPHCSVYSVFFAHVLTVSPCRSMLRIFSFYINGTLKCLKSQRCVNLFINFVSF